MSASRYAKVILAEIKDWLSKLTEIQNVMDAWLKVQATWLYLEPIFSSEDIMRQVCVCVCLCVCWCVCVCACAAPLRSLVRVLRRVAVRVWPARPPPRPRDPAVPPQMPEEGRRFKVVDDTWRDIMKKAVANPKALYAMRMEGQLEKLLEANKLLDLIQKGLNDYLETKRLFFPRFFFLSNDELLEILAETKDPLRVQVRCACELCVM